MDAMHVICFVLAYAGFLRYSDLAHVLVHRHFMRFADDGSGVSLYLCRSKTDQAGEGRWVHIPAEPDSAYCPVALLRWFLSAAGYVTNAEDRDCGPLARAVIRVPGGGYQLQQVTSSIQHPIPPLSADRLRSRLKSMLAAVGVDKDVGFHSLRIGGCMAAVKNGVSQQQAMEHGRWLDPRSHVLYRRSAQPEVHPLRGKLDL